MSLRSTIDAAREEAKEVAADRSVSKEKPEEKKVGDKPTYDPMNLASAPPPTPSP